MRLPRRTTAGAALAGLAAAAVAGVVASASLARDPSAASASPPPVPASPPPAPAAPASPGNGPTTPAPTGPSPAPVLLPGGPAAGTAPTPGGLAAAIAPVLRAEALRAGVGLAVLDAATGAQLYEREAQRPRVPASAAKLLTGAAALDVLGAQTRLRTRVLVGRRPGEIVLVGGGDPTLTVTRPGPVPDPRLRHRASTSLPELARATAAALKLRRTPAVTVVVDDGLFAGPGVSPDWRPGYLTQGVVGPVSALAVDAGRRRASAAARVADPALDAGARFAGLLAEEGLRVSRRPSRGRAPDGAQQLAAADSPPVHVLVEEALARSDNDVAEALARLVAVRRGRPATFAGGAAAVVEAVAGLGVPTAGIRLLDGSGLSRGSRVPPVTLARLVATGLDEGRPQLRALATGLPVAGFSGTLADRFTLPPGGPGRGAVRAKTGTHADSHALAGSVVDRDGRLLTFAVVADRVPEAEALEVRAELDRLAAVLAACGCR